MTMALAPLHIVKFQIENFMRIKLLRCEPQGKNLLITGSNGSGKTSCLDAIWVAFTGADSRAIPEPIHRGEKRASIVIETDEFILERRFTPSGGTILVTDRSGSKIAKPQQFLDALFGGYALDPNAFLQRRPQDQVADVLALAGVEPPIAAVADLTGENFVALVRETAWDYMKRLAGDDTGLFYVRRHKAGIESEIKAKALLDLERELIAAGGAPSAEAADQDCSQLVEELAALDLAADARRAAEKDGADLRAELVAAQSTMAELDGQAKSAADRIAALECELTSLRASLAVTETRIKNGRTTVADIEKDCAAAEKGIAEMPDPSPRIAVVRAAIKTSQATAKALSKRRSLSEQVERLRGESNVSKAKHEASDRLLQSLRSLQDHLLDDLDLGVNGLAVADGELRLDGVPFRQGSQAQRLRVACAVAMRQKPRLRLLRIDQGEQLDTESRRIIADLAKENEFEVIMAAVEEQEIEGPGGEVIRGPMPLRLELWE
jgi:hypothetical protein